jgi:serine protease
VCLTFPFGGGGGDGGSGDPCTADTDCATDDTFFATSGTCQLATNPDGGPSGYPGGYCTSTCQLGSCPGNGICLTTGCAELCTAPGTGRASCRAGYVCDTLYYIADGGLVPGEGACEPDCRNAGAACPAGTQCNTLGTCQ